VEDKARTINLAEAAALVDEHMGGCPALKRLVELLAAHYPNTPMPIAAKPAASPLSVVFREGEMQLCFVGPGGARGIYVSCGCGYPGSDETFALYVPEIYSSRFLTEEDVAERLADLLGHKTPLRQKLAAVLS
jgi:hypothetical protein